MSSDSQFLAANKQIRSLIDGIETVIFGQREFVTEAVCSFLSAGHILMTGAPGLAKTTLVRVFASRLGLDFGRVQFTPDLLPSDIVGSDILNMDAESGRRSFEFAKGPIFVNLLLADEINRASPRTQSALLEAMQEKTVTASGQEHRLPRPFMVFATQNPFESEGTFPLPEAQLDRFLLHSLVSYPDEASERAILAAHSSNDLVGEKDPQNWDAVEALTMAEIETLLAAARSVQVSDEMLEVVNRLVRATRPDDPSCLEELRPAIWYGAGPRAGISLVSACRALALIDGHQSVHWRHIRRLAKPALRHRIKVSAQAIRDGFSADVIVEKLLTSIEDRYKSLTRGES